MKAQEIRDSFTSYFQKNSHIKIASSSLIPHNDPTLLFANAGMNQFKDYFTGKAVAQNKKAVTIQKCVRAGGKHNDLENVGLTTRHHTFFEMLGNFSFGDYFKDDAIRMAWELLTVQLKIPKEKLLVTVHYTDNEALEIWNKKIGIPLERIFKKGDKDNFWEMGEFGPCGPCTEIFYDYGPAHAKKGFTPSQGQDALDDDERFVEIWNLVFMQFEKTPEGKFPLPRPSIDTGSGLERLTTAIQGKYWNYDTDLFFPIIQKLEEATGKKYIDPKYTTNMRILADHARACTMLITDGALPSNEGRGYVLRRIIRRAVRQLHNLEAPENFFHHLVPTVFEILGKEYPQNLANIELAKKILFLEEKKFGETLNIGLRFLSDAINSPGGKETKLFGKTLSGDAAFMLYDSYGFPLDLTQTILYEKGLSVDTEGFEKAMAQRKEDSRKSWKGGNLANTKIFYDAVSKNGKTQFTGYEETKSTAKLLDILDLGETKGLVFNKSPFYPEGGGQIGDCGQILENGNILATIDDTQKPVDDIIIHYSKTSDALEIGTDYELVVDNKRRQLTMRNHSATHLLQAALVKTLGNHVKQAGSSVGPDRLRFDFTHMQALSPEEILQIEKQVNEQIRNALTVNAKVMPIDEAQKIGATALFGEKYGDQVRVLNMDQYSIELCGGTHVHNTSEIGLFTIILETSLSSGVRRIEALTSETAIQYLSERSQILKTIERHLSVQPEKTLERIKTIETDLKGRNKEIEQLKDKIQSIESKSLFENIELIDSVQYKLVKVPEGQDLKKLSDLFMDKYPNGIVLLYLLNNDKATLLIRSSPKHKTIHCGNILKEALALMNGKGGGRPDMAQGSGDSNKINDAIKFAEEYIKNTLKK